MLTVVSNPTGGGTISVSPLGTPKYDASASITLSALPAAGYVFDNWTGDINSISDPAQNPVTFVMGHQPDYNRQITANFTQSDIRYTVIAEPEPNGAGLVRFQPIQPAGGYPINQSISLYAVPQTGYVFSHWVGDLAGDQNPGSILLTSDKAITAVFNPTITVYCSPSEGGAVTLEPSQTGNGYVAGTEVTINATPAKGYRFVSWEGDASESKQSIRVSADEAKTLTARFAEKAASRWWLWVTVAIVGLFGALILVRLVYARMNRSWADKPPQIGD